MRLLTLCRTAFLASLLALAACQPNLESNTYDAQNMGGAEPVVHGKIIAVRGVRVNKDTGVGGLAGAVAGGAAGSAIGGGARANIIGAVGGAVVGGLLGNAVEKGVSRQAAVQYIVQTRSGKTYAVVQATQPLLSVGQKVLVILGNPARVVADTQYTQ